MLLQRKHLLLKRVKGGFGVWRVCCDSDSVGSIPAIPQQISCFFELQRVLLRRVKGGCCVCCCCV